MLGDLPSYGILKLDVASNSLLFDGHRKHMIYNMGNLDGMNFTFHTTMFVGNGRVVCHLNVKL